MRERERDLPAQRVVCNVGDDVHQGKGLGPKLETCVATTQTSFIALQAQKGVALGLVLIRSIPALKFKI